MAGTVQSTGAFLINGFDATPYLKQFDTPMEQDILDCTTLSVTGLARTYQPGIAARSVTAEGLWSAVAGDATLSIDKTFGTAISSSAHQVITVTSIAPVFLESVLMFNTVEAKYSIKEVVGDLIMAQFEAKATDQTSFSDYAQGGWLIVPTTVTGAVNGTTYDSSTGGTGWFVHAHNVSADGTATVKVQHSTNGTVWVDLITFGGALAANTAAQSVDTSTSINRYIRAIVTAIGGTTAAVSVAMRVGYTG